MEYLQYLRTTRFLAFTCSVLNLVISGIPSILKEMQLKDLIPLSVLNLVISGIPSILEKKWKNWKDKLRF